MVCCEWEMVKCDNECMDADIIIIKSHACAVFTSLCHFCNLCHYAGRLRMARNTDVGQTRVLEATAK